MPISSAVKHTVLGGLGGAGLGAGYKYMDTDKLRNESAKSFKNRRRANTVMGGALGGLGGAGFGYSVHMGRKAATEARSNPFDDFFRDSRRNRDRGNAYSGDRSHRTYGGRGYTRPGNATNADDTLRGFGIDPSKMKTKAEAKKAYWEAAARTHPDKPGGDADKFKTMQDAWDQYKNSYAFEKLSFLNPIMARAFADEMEKIAMARA